MTPTGVPDASDQFLVLCLWFLPVSMALLAMVWFQRARKRLEAAAMNRFVEPRIGTIAVTRQGAKIS